MAILLNIMLDLKFIVNLFVLNFQNTIKYQYLQEKKTLIFLVFLLEKKKLMKI